MPLRPPSAPLDLGVRPLLLGDGGDVLVADLTDGAAVPSGHFEVDPSHPVPFGARVAAVSTLQLVVAAGVSLVVIPRSLADAPEVVAAAASGVVVAVTGRLDATAPTAGALRLEAGGDAIVVVEVPVTPGHRLITADDVAGLATVGLRTGALLPPLPARSPAAAGWVIGALTGLLAAGVQTVRGVDAERFGRVRNVHRAWEAGAAVELGP